MAGVVDKTNLIVFAADVGYKPYGGQKK